MLFSGERLGFAPLARALFLAAAHPVMLLYIYDGDFWGYDFYGKDTEDHFSALPDYFGPVPPEELHRLTGHPAALMSWFPIQQAGDIDRYLIHWSDPGPEEWEDTDTAYPGDEAPYGDCWQAADFMARLGFPWPFEAAQSAPVRKNSLPTLAEILEQQIPSVSGLDMLENYPLLRALRVYSRPSAGGWNTGLFLRGQDAPGDHRGGEPVLPGRLSARL